MPTSRFHQQAAWCRRQAHIDVRKFGSDRERRPRALASIFEYEDPMTGRELMPTLCGAAIALLALHVPNSAMGHDHPPGIDGEFLNNPLG